MEKDKQTFLTAKKERRIKKRTTKRGITGEEVIFIFEKLLEGWKTIKTYNTMIQQNPQSGVDKKKVEVISTGNSKVFENELSTERYQYYLDLREKVYAYHLLQKSKVPITNSVQNYKFGTNTGVKDSTPS
uniref:Uncharacterized protein n=1 Tax=viral metagenome TaxID=1070528 RepID=A0A6C0IMQ6_9ZZZZ